MRGALLLAAEVGLLVASAYFGGCLLERLPLCRWPRRFRNLWRVVLGLCAGTLFLLSLVQLNVPLRWGAWFGVALATGGAVAWWRERTKTTNMATTPWRRMDEALVAAVFLAVAALHAIPVVARGPEHYVAAGYADQYFYVSVSELAKTTPLREAHARADRAAWEADVAKFNPRLDERLGYVVPIGYPAALLGQEAKGTYGAAAIFFAGLTAAMVAAALRLFRVGIGWAAAGGIWAGVCPGLLRLELHSWFSQSSVLFVPLALAAILWSARHDLARAFAAMALLLGYTLAAYPELYAIFVGVALCLGATCSTLPWRRRIGFLAGAIAASALLGAFVLGDTIAFVWRQARAASADIDILAPLARNAGSWQFWQELFWPALQSARHPMLATTLNRLFLVGSVFMLVLAAAGVWSERRSERRHLLALLLLPVALVVGLRMVPPFHSYAYFKILTTWTPLVLVAAVLGTWRGAGRHAPRLASLVFAGGFVLPAGFAASVAWREIADGGALLPWIDTPELRAAYAVAERETQRPLWIVEDNPITARWLLYHARGRDVRVDRALPFWTGPNAYALPAAGEAVAPGPIVLSRQGAWDSTRVARPVCILVRTRPWPEAVAAGKKVRDVTGVDVLNFGAATTLRCRWACATAATLAPEHLRLLRADGAALALRFVADAIEFDLPVAAGVNRFQLALAADCPDATLGRLQSD